MTISTSLIVAPVVVGLAVVGAGVWVGNGVEDARPEGSANLSVKRIDSGQTFESALQQTYDDCSRCRGDSELVVERLQAMSESGAMRFDMELVRGLFNMPLGEIPGVVERLLREPKESESREVLELIFTRWGTEDMNGMLRWITDCSDRNEIEHYLGMFHEEWSRKDPSAFLEYYVGRPGSGNWDGNVRTALINLAQNDIHAALAFAERAPNENAQTWLKDSLISHWVESDPWGAFQHIRTFDQKLGSNRRMGRIVAELAKNNRGLALEVVDSMENEFLREACLASAVDQIAVTDPRTAAELVLAMQPSSQQRYSVTNVASAFAESDPKEAFEWVQSLEPGSLKNHALSTIASSVAEYDPKVLATLVAELPGGRLRDEMISTVSSSLAQNDLDEGIRWMRQQQDSGSRSRALAAMAVTWSLTDPSAAMNEVVQFIPESQRPEILRQMGASWSANNIEQIDGRIRQIPEGPDRDAIVFGVIDTHIYSSPKTAALYAASLTTEEGGHRLKRIGENLVAEGPEKAAAWAGSLANESNRTEAVVGVVSQWAENDPESAGLWVAAMTPGGPRAAAASALVGGMTYSYPEVAAEWVWMIDDPYERELAVSRIAAQWRESDPASANTWMKKFGVSEARTQEPSQQDTFDDEEVIILSNCHFSF